jgi:hypothetical protein
MQFTTYALKHSLPFLQKKGGKRIARKKLSRQKAGKLTIF